MAYPSDSECFLDGFGRCCRVDHKHVATCPDCGADKSLFEPA